MEEEETVRPRIRWSRVFGVLLTSKLFFVASCTSGVVMVNMADMGRESGRHGDIVRPIDDRMEVVASIPVEGKGGERKVVSQRLRELDAFMKKNPDYSFF